MANAPSLMPLARIECCKCKKRLLPWESFKNNYEITVLEQILYVFNEGEYFQPEGQPFKYECNDCFHKSIGEQEAVGGRVSFLFTESEETDILKKEVGKVELYKDWKQYAKRHGGRIGYLINADHQPPVSSILKAGELNPNSELAEVMFEVANSSQNDSLDKVQEHHGLELPVVYVPAEVHREFPSTISPNFREHLATIIRGGDVVGAFKTTILGARPRFRLTDDSRFKNFERGRSQTRLRIFENSFKQHSIKMVEKWSNLLKDKGVMTEEDVNEIKTWIDGEGYNTQNDPHREQVSGLL